MGTMREKVGILYQPKSLEATELAQRLSNLIKELDASAWVCSAWEENIAKECVEGTDLVICLGGDGTILRAARIVNPLPIPIASVNLGRVGFLTDLPAYDALDAIPSFIRGEGDIEERSMLEIKLVKNDNQGFCALNDAFVGRGERCRLVRINVKVDDEVVTNYKCDGVIVSTATGSTGYSHAAGGPVLHPLSKDMIIKPVAAHLCSNTALVLPCNSLIELEINTTHKAMLSVDGQVEVELSNGDVVVIKGSEYTTRLLKYKRPKNYYGMIIGKLLERE